jgi:glycosyltransferase involved in cell wall biosynthesis
MKKVLILFSVDSLRRGGKERQLMLLFTNLSSNKYCKQIAVQDFNGNTYLIEYEIDAKQIFVFNGLRDFYKLVKEIKPDIVFSWDTKSSLFSLMLRPIGRYKFINGSIRHGIRLYRFSHYLRSFIAWLSPVVVANSEAGLTVNNMHKGRTRFVMFNGIENDFIKRRSNLDKTEHIRQYFPNYLPGKSLVFISIANLVPYKDYLTVLKALNHYRDEVDFFYFIIGDGPKRMELTKEILKHNLSERVYMVGSTEDVQTFLQISDIMIHSSRGEGISNAILEGMYAGLPIIATNVGGVPETVYPGSSMLFPYKDDKALLDCLLKAPETFTSFNPESEEYKKHLNKFSVETMLNRFEEILSMVTKSE